MKTKTIYIIIIFITFIGYFSDNYAQEKISKEKALFYFLVPSINVPLFK